MSEELIIKLVEATSRNTEAISAVRDDIKDIKKAVEDSNKRLDRHMETEEKTIAMMVDQIAGTKEAMRQGQFKAMGFLIALLIGIIGFFGQETVSIIIEKAF